MHTFITLPFLLVLLAPVASTSYDNTNGLLVVSVSQATSTPCGSDAVTGVTDNGVSLTDLGYYARSDVGALKTYYLFSPPEGAHNIAVSASASCILYTVAASYTGVAQSGMPNASGTGNPLADSGSVTTFQATTTPSGVNAWTILAGVPQKGTGSAATAGPGTAIRQQHSGNLVYADSNGPVSGASGLSWTTASPANWLAHYFALSPAASDPGTTATTTYAYDQNGNLTQLTTGATTTAYAYDYQNRLIASRTTGASATTTYGYDSQGNRMFQQTASTTTLYPSKYLSVTQYLNGDTTHATSTEYLWAGDLLLATIDTPSTTIGATTTTATSTTRYLHPDNLGSTQATSDSSGNFAQYFNYAPYGALLHATSSDPAAALSRQYIGQFTDDSGLSYLNARYYNGAQGQFLSQDPLFWNRNQNISNPQDLAKASNSRAILDVCLLCYASRKLLSLTFLLYLLDVFYSLCARDRLQKMPSVPECVFHCALPRVRGYT